MIVSKINVIYDISSVQRINDRKLKDNLGY